MEFVEIEQMHATFYWSELNYLKWSMYLFRDSGQMWTNRYWSVEKDPLIFAQLSIVIFLSIPLWLTTILGLADGREKSTIFSDFRDRKSVMAQA